MISIILEGHLNEERNEELGYSNYDYRHKKNDNSHNALFTLTWIPISCKTVSASLICTTIRFDDIEY